MNVLPSDCEGEKSAITAEGMDSFLLSSEMQKRQKETDAEGIEIVCNALYMP